MVFYTYVYQSYVKEWKLNSVDELASVVLVQENFVKYLPIGRKFSADILRIFSRIEETDIMKASK